MQIPKRVIKKSLKKKGFVEKEGDHKYFYHEYKGKRTGAYAKVSHGSRKYKDYGIQLIRLLKRQLLLILLKKQKSCWNALWEGKNILIF